MMQSYMQHPEPAAGARPANGEPMLEPSPDAVFDRERSETAGAEPAPAAKSGHTEPPLLELSLGDACGEKLLGVAPLDSRSRYRLAAVYERVALLLRGGGDDIIQEPEQVHVPLLTLDELTRYAALSVAAEDWWAEFDGEPERWRAVCRRRAELEEQLRVVTHRRLDTVVSRSLSLLVSNPADARLLWDRLHALSLELAGERIEPTVAVAEILCAVTGATGRREAAAGGRTCDAGTHPSDGKGAAGESYPATEPAG